METTNIKTGFAWKPEDHTETRRVELLITRAEGIYQDHFDNSDVQFEDHQSEKLSTYNLQQWNPDGGIFCLCLSLEPGVYHFVFRVDNGRNEELKTSEFYDQTYLGNGRAVNYIELKSSGIRQKVGNTKIRRRPRSAKESLSESFSRSKSDAWSIDSDGNLPRNSHDKSCTLL